MTKYMKHQIARIFNIKISFKDDIRKLNLARL